MNSLLIITAVLAALLILDCLLLRAANKVTLYRYRNLAYASLLPALFVMLCVAVYDLVFLCRGGSISTLYEMASVLPDRFANLMIALFLVMAILMTVSNISLIRHEGMHVKNAIGSLLEFSCIVGTVIIGIAAELIRHRGSDIFICRALPVFLFSMLDYFECVILGIMIMGYIAARQKPKYDKDFIIIPGCSIAKGGGLLPLLRGRVNRAIRYAWDQEIASGRPVCYVPSGGQGPDEIMSEGSAMEFYLLSHAAEENEVFPEKKSTNTLENFTFSAKIIRDLKPDANVAFATTNYHVLRCGILARQAGLDAEGIASGTKWYFWPNGFAREIIALFNMTRKVHLLAAAVILVLCIIFTI